MSDYILGSDAVLEAADRWIATLFDAFESIAGMPGIGHSRRDLTAFPLIRNALRLYTYIAERALAGDSFRAVDKNGRSAEVVLVELT